MVILQSVVCALAFTCLIGSSLCISRNRANLRSVLNDVAKTGVKNEKFEEVVDAIKFPHMFRSNYEPTENSSFYCGVCDDIVDTILTERRNGRDKKTLARYIVTLCDSMHIESSDVCPAFVAANLDTVLYIVDNTPKLTSKHFCSVVLQNYGCKSDTPVEWSVNIPEASPSLNLTIPRLTSTETVNILHISDIHYDPNYVVGSLAACDAPLCCQAKFGNPKNSKDAAGRWGDYRNCDTPWPVIETLEKHVKNNFEQIDFVYFTGNILNHNVWGTERLNHSVDYITALHALEKAYEEVFPVLGSYEPYPVDEFGENTNSTVSIKWERWARILSRCHKTRRTITKGGYYTCLTKDEWVRIVALNTNACNPYNFWLIQNEVDPFEQLDWLVKVLIKAEESKKERVHILMHMPSGKCLKNWSREFRRIVDRFSGIISAIFNGNSHKDTFNIYYKKKNISKIATVAFNGGSVSPYSGGNPNYRVYSMRPPYMYIDTADTFIYNLTEANLTPNRTPAWTHQQTTLSYLLMGKKGLEAYFQQLITNSTMLDSYFKYYHKQGEVHLSRGCDSKCKLKLLCEIVDVEFGDTAKCKEITDIFNSQ